MTPRRGCGNVLVVSWKVVGRGTLILSVGVGVPAPHHWIPSQKDSTTSPFASVSGQVTVIDKGDKRAKDVGDAVVWLEPLGSSLERLRTDTVNVVMSKKEFRPHVVVVTVGSSVAFPNQDPFNHNVFSRSEIAVFDLGRYGRGGVRSVDFSRAGFARVFCNVHARMSAIVVVRDSPYFARPTGDGSFSIPAVPPGEYVVHAWHERAKAFRPRRIQVTDRGADAVSVELDARDYEFVQHVNKYGQPYSRARRGRRY